MMIGVVSATVTSTIRTAALRGYPLVAVRVTDEVTRTVIACNPLSAGVGDTVIVAVQTAARNALAAPDSGVDAAIVAIVDDAPTAD